MKQALFKFFYICVELSSIVVLCLGIFYLYGGYLITTPDERVNLVHHIKSAPELPDKLFEMHNKVYPESCSCLSASSYYNTRKRHGNWLNITLISNMLEHEVSEKECFDFYLSRVDFLHGAIGVEAASKLYYKKNLKELTFDEMLHLVAMIKNTSFFNPLSKRREQLELRVKILKEKLIQNE